MSITLNTGWVRVSDGGKTDLDLSGFSGFISARVKWRGVDEAGSATTVLNKTESGVNQVSINSTFPDPFTGVFSDATFLHCYITSIRGKHDYAHTSGIDKQAILPYNTNLFWSESVPTDTWSTARVTGYLYDSRNPGAAFETIFQHSSAGITSQIQFQSVAYTNYTAHTKNPSLSVGGDSASHSGTLANTVESAWYNVTGLVALQNNEITHNVQQSSVMDVYIEYTVEALPILDTLPADNIAYQAARLRGDLVSTGTLTTTRYFEYGETTSYELGDINKGTGSEGIYTHDLSGLTHNTTYYYRAWAENSEGRGNGAQETFTTPYAYFPAPHDRTPAASASTSEQRPVFTFTLGDKAENPATHLHARVRVSGYITMTPVTLTLESSAATGTWEYWDGAAWLAFPGGGVVPGTTVRVTPTSDLAHGDQYWDCASYDGAEWGINATAFALRITLTIEGIYTLTVDGTAYNVFDLRVVEASNGELGSIIFSVDSRHLPPAWNMSTSASLTKSFSLSETFDMSAYDESFWLRELFDEHDDIAYDLIDYGDEVILAIRDFQGDEEEFQGIVRGKYPNIDILTVTAIMGDGILAERIVKEDYTSQDIGQTVHNMVTTYCAGLTATNIDITTGHTAPVPANGDTVLRAIEDLRRQYRLFYYVDNLMDTHLYLEDDIGGSTVAIRGGD